MEIEELLKEHNLDQCNGYFSPLNVDTFEVAKTGDNNKSFDQATYRRAIGNLLYLANCTRPDLSFAVSFLGQFCEAPLKAHWVGVKHVLRYLKQTKELSLTYSKTNKPPQYFCDADFSQNKYDRKSFSGFISLFAGGAVVWSCRKQTSVSMSTVVAEYLAMSSAIPEVLWFNRTLIEMGFDNYAPKPPTLLVDNSGAMFVAKSRSISRKTKRIDERHHYIRDEFQKGNIRFAHISSSENVADILTKSLPPARNKVFLRAMGLLS